MVEQVHRVRVEPSGLEVDCRGDQSILDACLRSGIWLPHACTHGTCGTCKAELLEGSIDFGDASGFALMDFERDEGKALLCCARPLSDVVVEAEVDVEEGVELHPVRDHRATVVEIEDCARGTRRLRLALEGDLSFNPGQYVQIQVPGTKVKRSYSLANPPCQQRSLELHVRRTPGGLASEQWVFGSLQVGDEIDLSGPFGRFFLHPLREEPIIMVAGGTGLAPIESMVRHMLVSGLDRQITLYQGARGLEHIYDTDVLAALQEEHPDRFCYRPCLDAETVVGFERGLVTDVIERDHPGSLEGHVAYVCGPPPMVDATLRTLMKKRLFGGSIFREDFYDESDKARGVLRSPLLKR
ncbi:MAG: FAD-binding oxidoreductase [Actinomycetota bacterium]|nr:FAD-binding oxidoreductase [Actinomycetota bacterium]MDA8076273.1 FAD-binding oxidoreductase [Actinomycetota bacterium]